MSWASRLDQIDRVSGQGDIAASIVLRLAEGCMSESENCRHRHLPVLLRWSTDSPQRKLDLGVDVSKLKNDHQVRLAHAELIYVISRPSLMDPVTKP